MAEQPWRLDVGSASLRLPRLSAVVRPLAPVVGLDELRIDGHLVSATCRPLGVELTGIDQSGKPAAIEQYVRGGDLVATYMDCPAPALRTQIYWRVNSHPSADAVAAVELVISVQTSLLNSSPRLATRSLLAVDEARCLTSTDAARRSDLGRSSCYLYRLAETPFSYAEMVEPAQSLESVIEGDVPGADARFKRLALRHELFPERLEKGVILRARVLGVFLDRRDDQSAAERHYAAFLSAEPPLTT